MGIEKVSVGSPDAQVRQTLRDTLNYGLGMGQGNGLTWPLATSRFNALAGDLALDGLADNQNGAESRSNINAVIDALGIPSGLDLYADFTTGRMWDNGPASMGARITDTWSGGYLPNEAADYEAYAANRLAQNKGGLWTQPQATNGVPNSGLVGAVAGSPGSVPNGWAAFGNPGVNLERQSIQLYTYKNLPAIRIRMVGNNTAVSNAAFSLGPSGVGGYPVIPGNMYSISCYIGVVANSGVASDNGGSLLRAWWYDASGTQVGLNDIRFDNVSGGTQSLVHGTFEAPAGAAFLILFVRQGFLANNNYDLTYEIAAPQITDTSFVVPPIITMGSAATRTGNRQVIDLTGRLGYGVAGFYKMDWLAVETFRRQLMFYSSAGPSANYTGIEIGTSAGQRWVGTSGGVYQGIGAVSPEAFRKTGMVTVAFAMNSTTRWLRVVGDAQRTWAIEQPPLLDRMGIGGFGANAGGNTYQVTKKLGLIFGTPSRPINQDLFDQVYAMAVAA